MIEISEIVLGEAEERLVLEVLRSGRLAQGPMVERFESLVAEMAGTKHAMAMTSGTTALVASLQALELGPGDEVVTSPFTFAATLNAILEAGAVARFADIGDDHTVDVDALEAAITARTTALLPVHLYGLPADMSRVEPIATQRGLAIVEDAAQAHGAEVGGRKAGSYGLGCFSFYATKNVTTGEGGAVTTDDDDLADRLRLLRSQGMRHRYRYEMPGHNYRMTELQAAIGIPQMERLRDITERRQRNAARLTELLSDVEEVLLPAPSAGRTHVFHQYTVEMLDDRLSRDEIVDRLAALGVRAAIYYPRLVFDYPCYAEHPHVRIDDVPRARRAATRVLSLPVHPGLSEADLEHIADAVRKAIGA